MAHGLFQRVARTVPRRVSITDVLGVVVLLPPIVYGGGYFLWIAPSMRLYGENVAPLLGVSALILPGIYYAAVIALGLLFASVLGLERLWEIPQRAPQWATRGLPRWLFGVFDLVFWIGVIYETTSWGFKLVHDGPPMDPLAPPWDFVYLVGHVVLLGFIFRRFHGLVRSRLAAPRPDHRVRSPLVRILESVLAVVLLFGQFPLAVLFGAIGPNPARTVRRVELTLRLADAAGKNGRATRVVQYIDRDNDHLLAFDETDSTLVEIPRETILEMQWR